MRWEDERYVRVYTRDTGEWLALGWEAQAIFLFALRKADRAGIVRTGKAGARGLAGMTGIPLDVVTRSLPLLLEDGCVRECDGGYIIPNFIAAQEVPISDAQRKRDQRERDRDKALANGGAVQKSVADTQAEMSRRAVTSDATPGGHAMASPVESHQTVTSGHAGSVTPNRAVPIRSDPSQDLPPPAIASAASGQGQLLPDVPPTPPAKPAKKAKEAKKPPPDKPTDPRHADLVAKLTAEGWSFDGGKDAANVKALLGLADQQEATRGELAGMEVLRRARIAWGQFPGFHSARTLTGLRSKWGEFAALESRLTGPPRMDPNQGILRQEARACAGCARHGDGARIGEPSVWLCYQCLGAWQDEGLHFTKAAEWADARKRAA
jgi:hypothetical protein